MTMLVSVCRVSHIPVGAELDDFHKAHKEVFGDAVGKMTFLRDPQDANQAAHGVHRNRCVTAADRVDHALERGRLRRSVAPRAAML